MVQEDMGEDSMLCTKHPYKNTSPGGICPSCLQEKLGNLVSSSLSISIFPSTSSSQTPSFRSDFGGASLTTTTTTTTTTITTTTTTASHEYSKSRSSKFPFLLTQRGRKKKDGNMVFQRSKSTATPKNLMHFGHGEGENKTTKKGFWSFLHLSSKKHGDLREKGMRKDEFIVLQENDVSPDEASFDRKVSRSRSVGCGSRSFSGDFFTGLGDCTLRRVESHREGKGGNGQDCMRKERVRCGGLFGGFMMIASSSSSSSSSSYWVSSSSGEDHNVNGKTPASVGNHLGHGRSKNWGWAFASPMRAFGSKNTSNGKKIVQNNKESPNLAAIPSLLGAKN